MSKPITHEKALALALEMAVRELVHVEAHLGRGWCPALRSAVERAEKALERYKNDEDPAW